MLFWLTDSADYNRPELEFIINYPYTDTTKTLITRIDTIMMRYIQTRQQTSKEKPVTLGLYPNFQARDIKPSQKISFTSSTPIVITNPERVKMWEVVDTVFTEINASFAPDSTDPRKIQIDAPLKEGRKYQINIFPGAISDIYGLQNDTIKLPFSVKSQEDYGRLKLTLENSPGRTIIQLLDQQERTGPGNNKRGRWHS